MLPAATSVNREEIGTYELQTRNKNLAKTIHSVHLQNTSQIKEHLVTAALTSDFPFPERNFFSRV
jgi:hypothetical protein